MNMLKKLLKVSATVFVILALQGTAVFAHSKAIKNNPAIGTVVSTEVSDIELGFNKKFRLLKFKLFSYDKTVDPESKDMDAEGLTEIERDFSFSKKFSKSTTVTFAPIQDGSYVYHWSGVAKDGHKIKGHGYFSVSINANE